MAHSNRKLKQHDLQILETATQKTPRVTSFCLPPNPQQGQPDGVMMHILLPKSGEPKKAVEHLKQGSMQLWFECEAPPQGFQLVVLFGDAIEPWRGGVRLAEVDH